MCNDEIQILDMFLIPDVHIGHAIPDSPQEFPVDIEYVILLGDIVDHMNCEAEYLGDQVDCEI